MQLPKRKADQYLRGRSDATMTLKKYEELKAKREKLIKVVRPRQSEEVQKYAQDGDFSENAAYQIAKGKLRGTNRVIDEIEDMLKRADIIETVSGSSTVRIGSTVIIEINSKEKTYQILGASETDPSSGIISKDSPLARVIMGKRAGETATLEINGKTAIYKIIEIK
jgi:transcription elongation factor GreA